ncbi:MAG: ABC transporter permease subunit [Frankia sp.]
MNELLPFIIAGVTVGSVYSLAGVGLVLTYKTSGIFNFSHGALATLAAYVFYAMNVEHGIPWEAAAFLTVFVLGPLLGILFESFGRGLARVAMAWQITATVGVLLSIESLSTIIWGSGTRTFPHFLPRSGFTLSGVNVTWEQVIVTAIPLAASAVLYGVFRVTRVGMSMRAVVESPELLALAGTSPNNVRRWAWIIGCSFATLSGILLAPSVSLDPTTLTLLIVQAFGAAAIGNFSSLPMTWAGGIVIGVVGSVITKYGTSNTLIAGLSPSLPFIVLFLVLVLSPRSRLRVSQIGVAVQPRAWRAPNRVQLILAVAFVGLLACVPLFAGIHLNTYTIMLTIVLIFLSLGLLARLAGQVSLCQLTFAAIGAAEFSRLNVHAHLPWLVALLVAGLIAVPIGAVLAIPAIRVSGLFLALATLGFGLTVQDMFYPTKLMFGFGEVGLQMPRPNLSWLSLDTDRGFYYVVLAITVVIAIGTVTLTRTRLGRMLRGIADSPTAMQSNGNSGRVALVVVFCTSAFIAAIAGALQGMVYGVAGGLNYSPITSVLYLAVVLISVGTEPWYALFPAASLALLPLYVTSSNTSNYLQLVFGVAAVGMALAGPPNGRVLAGLREWIERVGGRRSMPALIAASDGGMAKRADPISVEVRDLAVRFGGLEAVRAMSLSATPGRVTGLIGPNGAGKTTTLNAISGLVSPSAGQVLFNGRKVGQLSPASRARLGLGRTFQQIELCDSLSVWDNVVLGREAALAGASVLRQLVPRRGDSKAVRDSVAYAIDRCGLTHLANAQAGTISSSERRFLEVARCLAGSFSFLLLDEPSSGLDKAATARLAALVRDLVEQENIGVLIVEHDMSLVMSTCDDIYVMDFGGPLFHGPPEDVRQSREVQTAYLGAQDAKWVGEHGREIQESPDQAALEPSLSRNTRD